MTRAHHSTAGSPRRERQTEGASGQDSSHSLSPTVGQSKKTRKETESVRPLWPRGNGRQEGGPCSQPALEGHGCRQGPWSKGSVSPERPGRVVQARTLNPKSPRGRHAAQWADAHTCPRLPLPGDPASSVHRAHSRKGLQGESPQAENVPGCPLPPGHAAAGRLSVVTPGWLQPDLTSG